MKRRRTTAEEEDQYQGDITPKRLRSRVVQGSVHGSSTITPSMHSRTRVSQSLPKTITTQDAGDPQTPFIKGKLLFTTPKKHQEIVTVSPSPAHVRSADRSARRKSARRLIERTIAGDISDNNPEEDELAKEIRDDKESEEDETKVNSEDISETDCLPDTPSKRPPGRRKGTRRKRSTTPSQNLSSYEQYFFHNRPGGNKTSASILSTLSLLTHHSYHSHIAEYPDTHTPSISFLHFLHSKSFPLWTFELSQSFSVCLYGYGSKRRLVTAFANHLHFTRAPDSPVPITIIVNGYIPTITPRQILTIVISALPKSSFPSKLPIDCSSLLALVTAHLVARSTNQPIYIIVNSLDAPPLRTLKTQSLLATLADHPSIRLLATCDTLSFPLLWDISLRNRFNWVFHDTTTFIPFDDGNGTGEIGGVVDIVSDLMGRKGASGKGREGVRWVLRSLPENARGLYRVLIAELLASSAEGEAGLNGNDALEEDFGEDFPQKKTPHKRPNSDDTGGVEYRVLYQKAVEEFLCSSEMAFRMLLKEFHDHQMVVSRRDGAGGEILGVPMRRDEMEEVLEDLMG